MRPPTTPNRLPPTSVTTELLDASCAWDSAQVQKLIGGCRRSRLPHPPGCERRRHRRGTLGSASLR